MAETLRVRSRFITNPVWVLSLSALLAATLIGCGSGNQIASKSTTAATSSPADNWQFLLAPASSGVALTNDIEAVVSLTPGKSVGTAYIIAAAYRMQAPAIPLTTQFLCLARSTPRATCRSRQPLLAVRCCPSQVS